jgi:hypothetical protein
MLTVSSHQDLVNRGLYDLLFQFRRTSLRTPCLFEAGAKLLESLEGMLAKGVARSTCFLEVHLRGFEGHEPFVPTPFEVGRHQSVSGVDLVVLLERTASLVSQLVDSLLEHPKFAGGPLDEAIACDEACFDSQR